MDQEQLEIMRQLVLKQNERLDVHDQLIQKLAELIGVTISIGQKSEEHQREDQP